MTANQIQPAEYDFITTFPWEEIELPPVVAENENPKTEQLRDQLEQGRVRTLSNPPPEVPPLLTANGHNIGEPGNLVTVEGLPKSGKSALVSAVLAAGIGGTGDCLGFASQYQDGRAVVHFDCEQSGGDHFRLLETAARRRANLPDIPDFLRSYSLLRIRRRDRQEAMRLSFEEAARECGGVRLVVLDGAADFVSDPNDAAEAFQFVEDLHALAEEFEAVIVSVIHQNPGTDIGKTRGHLGSELHRKVQTSIIAEKGADGICSLYGKDLRRGDWPKDQATFFEYSAEQGMHVTVADPTARRTAEKMSARNLKLQALAQKVCKGPMSHTELEKAVMRAEQIEERAARNRIKIMVSQLILEKTDAGEYQISEQCAEN